MTRQGPPCAKRARRLRQQQCREGWHRDDKPLPEPDEPSDGQRALIVLRAHSEFEHNRAIAAAEWDQVAELDEAIAEVEQAVTESGMRGAVARAQLNAARERAAGWPPGDVSATVPR